MTSALVDQFGAIQRRSWGHDALYHQGRLFVLFDNGDLVGKWPDSRRSALLASDLDVRPFVADDSPGEAMWLRVPLVSFSDVSDAIRTASPTVRRACMILSCHSGGVCSAMGELPKVSIVVIVPPIHFS